MVANHSRPRVVIVGFGGFSVAKALARSPFEVVLIDRQNYPAIAVSGRDGRPLAGR